MSYDYRPNEAQRKRRGKEMAPAVRRHEKRRAEERRRLEIMEQTQRRMDMTPQNDVRGNVKAMESVVGEVVKAMKGYRAKAASIYKNPDIADAGKAVRAVAARDEAAERLEELRDLLGNSHAAVKEGVVKMEAEHDAHPDRNSAVHESRVSRAWQRTEKLLGSGENAIALLNAAAEDGDAPTLAALYEEAPAYFTANGQREQGEEVRSKARELRGVVEGGLLGEALAAEAIADRLEDDAHNPLRDAGSELEGGSPVKDFWLGDGSIVSMRDTMDVAKRVNSDSQTHAAEIREAANG
jgi:hypothetical protein